MRFLADESCDFAVVELIGQQGERLPGCFVVMQPGRTRINRTPEP
jgi:hypothetical protein